MVRFGFELVGAGALGGGESGVGWEDGGGSETDGTSGFVSGTEVGAFSLDSLFAATRAANGNSSEGSESVSTWVSSPLARIVDAGVLPSALLRSARPLRFLAFSAL